MFVLQFPTLREKTKNGNYERGTGFLKFENIIAFKTIE
jgi:hypothetical protein